MLDIGQKTPWGRVTAIGKRDGERYYMMMKAGVVSLIPEGDTEVTDLVNNDPEAKVSPSNPPSGASKETI